MAVLWRWRDKRYFYSIHAQLKAVIDRTLARWLEVKDKEFCYIVTAADGEVEAAATTIACFRSYADCVEGAKEMGIVYGMGAYEKGEIWPMPMKWAREYKPRPKSEVCTC